MNKIILVIVLLVLVAGGYYLWGRGNEAPSPSTSPTASPIASVTPTPSTKASQEVLISYTDSGYSPSTVTVKKGNKVTFINNSSGLMWPASSSHPTHDVLPEFDALKGIAVGHKYSFTFSKEGTWKFHNHLKPQFVGQVVVQ